MLLAAAASSCGTGSGPPDAVRPVARDSGRATTPDLLPVVRLDFDDVRLEGDRVVTRNDADTQVQVRVLTAANGSVSVVPG